MSKKRLSDEKILAILKGLFEDNKGNTQVAVEVLGKKTKESTVRNIKRVYKKHGNYFGVTLDGVVDTESLNTILGLRSKDNTDKIIELHLQGYSSRKICRELGVNEQKKSTVNLILSEWREGKVEYSKSDTTLKTLHPKVLLIDLETAPCKMYGWSLWNQNFGLNQIESEWYILSYSAKWLGSDEVIYKDLKGKVNTEDDSELLHDLWLLMDEAQLVVGQNHRKFDIKKLNARLIMHGYKPYSPVKTEDTLDIAKRKFGFTSNKLEWLTDKLCVQFKKQTHGNFAGFELWRQCMLENEEAWEEMRIYNIYDVLSLEELWLKLRAWDDRSVNYALYLDDTNVRCTCGSTSLVKDGYAYTSLSKFQQFRCNDCGSFVRGRTNLFSKEKRASLLMNVTNR